jgi:hypothetical protein
MRAIIVFDSMFGNTRQVAYAIAEGMGRYADVELLPVDDAPRRIDERVALVVVGGPTHAHGLSSRTTRRVNSTQAAEGATTSRLGLKEWLVALAAPSRRLAVATFDTRFPKPRWLTGSAAVLTARWLVRQGCTLVAPPQSFYIEHGSGPLQPGELDRARRWGATLARAVRAVESTRRQPAT